MRSAMRRSDDKLDAKINNISYGIDRSVIRARKSRLWTVREDADLILMREVGRTTPEIANIFCRTHAAGRWTNDTASDSSGALRLAWRKQSNKVGFLKTLIQVLAAFVAIVEQPSLDG